MPLAATAGTSAHYSLSPAVVDNGGLTASSSKYRSTATLSAGGAGSSAKYSARSGFAGQLIRILNQAIATGMTITASSLTVDEAGNLQFNATLTYNDSTTTPLDASAVTWSVQSGPVASVSTMGLATAGRVYQDTAAIVRGVYQNFSNTVNLTVSNTGNDDFGLYTTDGISDLWQVQYFGENGTQGGPTVDSDRDGLNNLKEYAFGMNPTLSKISTVAWSGATWVGRGVPTQSITTSAGISTYRAVFARRKDYVIAKLAYTVEFSSDLVRWSASTATPTVLADDGEIEAVAVPCPSAKISFFRIKVQTL